MKRTAPRTRAPMRGVMKVYRLPTRPSGFNYQVELECGHAVLRKLLRLGYNRDHDDRIACQRCMVEANEKDGLDAV